MDSETLKTLITGVWQIAWDGVLPVVLLFVGVYFTLGTRVFQVRRFATILSNTIGLLFVKRSGDSPGILTSFQAWATATGSAVGMGNIAGVSSAIAMGGPGALFWLWISATVGMATKMAEVSLAVHFREEFPDGKTYGGPTFYIEKGLGRDAKWPQWAWKLLIGMFCTGMVVMLFVGMASYSVQEIFQATFSTTSNQAIAFGLGFMLLIYSVIIGGIKRLGQVAAVLLPGMAMLYILGGLGVLLVNVTKLPEAFEQIFKYAFEGKAAVAGVGGYSITKAFQNGVARGVYSNEAGWGTSPMIHATAKVDHPVRQGLWGAFEVFLDTIVICSITGLVIVTSGLWKEGNGGAGDVALAFSEVYGAGGMYFIFAAMMVFVFTTCTGWYGYYETLLMHFFRGKPEATAKKWVRLLRILTPLPSFILGALAIKYGLKPAVVWLIGDVSSAISIVPNLIALLALSPIVFRLIKDFEQKHLN